MLQHLATLAVQTRGRGLLEITREVRACVARSGIAEGLLTLFVRHTSASLLIQENADPDVRDDLERFFARLVRDGDTLFQHRTEGPDDMPAHVRSTLTATQLSIDHGRRIGAGHLARRVPVGAPLARQRA